MYLMEQNHWHNRNTAGSVRNILRMRSDCQCKQDELNAACKLIARNLSKHKKLLVFTNNGNRSVVK
jgi:hypothetical protein